MRFGIVGTNFVSDMFMAGAEGKKEVEVSAVCSGHRENAERFADKYHISTVYDSLDQMLEDHKIDVVYLAVPNSMHYEMTMQCINAGVNVFTEKPFMVTALQAEKIFTAAEQKGVYVHDGLVPLYTENFRRVKDALGSIGTIHQAVFNFSRYSSRFDAYRAGRNPTTFRRELCNGCLMDMGVYCIGDLAGLFGRPEKIIASASLLDTGVDGSAEVILKYKTFDCIVLASKASTSYNASEIMGEDGTIVIDKPSLIEKAVRIDRKSGEKTEITRNSESLFGEQLIDLTENIKAGRKESSRLPHALSLEIIRIVEECRKQAGIIYDCDGE